MERDATTVTRPRTTWDFGRVLGYPHDPDLPRHFQPYGVAEGPTATASEARGLVFESRFFDRPIGRVNRSRTERGEGAEVEAEFERAMAGSERWLRSLEPDDDPDAESLAAHRDAVAAFKAALRSLRRPPLRDLDRAAASVVSATATARSSRKRATPATDSSSARNQVQLEGLIAAGRQAWARNVELRRSLAYAWINEHPEDFEGATTEALFVAAFVRVGV